MILTRLRQLIKTFLLFLVAVVALVELLGKKIKEVLLYVLKSLMDQKVKEKIFENHQLKGLVHAAENSVDLLDEADKNEQAEDKCSTTTENVMIVGDNEDTEPRGKDSSNKNQASGFVSSVEVSDDPGDNNEHGSSEIIDQDITEVKIYIISSKIKL